MPTPLISGFRIEVLQLFQITNTENITPPIDSEKITRQRLSYKYITRYEINIIAQPPGLFHERMVP